MKTLIIFDSLYGNTAKVAGAMGAAFDPEAKVLSIAEAKPEDLSGYELIIFGSPTHGGQPKQSTRDFLLKVPVGALKSAKVAAFDTRMEFAKQSAFLKLVMKVVNYAAPRLLKSLVAKGGEPVGEPLGIIVEDSKGPLKSGEEARAQEWAKGLL